MHGLRIQDGTEPGGCGGLEFDLVKVLEVLGQAASRSRWACAYLHYVSTDDQDIPVLERAVTPGATVSGAELVQGTGRLLQVIDGQFTALDAQGDVWVIVRAVDSSWWEVWSDDKWVQDAIRASFRVVCAIPSTAG